MKKVFAFLLIIFYNTTSNCQTNELNSKSKCSDLILQLSKEWKQDSLTSNGFRRKAFKELRNCIVDTVTVDFLIKCLGKPVIIQKFYSGNTNANYVEYIYYYWDSYTIPNESPFERLFIGFVYDEAGEVLQYIHDGMYCG